MVQLFVEQYLSFSKIRFPGPRNSKLGCWCLPLQGVPRAKGIACTLSRNFKVETTHDMQKAQECTSITFACASAILGDRDGFVGANSWCVGGGPFRTLDPKPFSSLTILESANQHVLYFYCDGMKEVHVLGVSESRFCSCD